MTRRLSEAMLKKLQAEVAAAAQKGGWLARASFGWLPASYLRTMPG